MVPAFSGLYAPYWKENARGVIVGLTRFANKGHLARAVLEAVAFQTREVVEAMEQDSGIRLDVLRADGGMVNNNLLMQFQADILERPVVLPATRETTSLGPLMPLDWRWDFSAARNRCASTGRRKRPGNLQWSGRAANRCTGNGKSGDAVVRLGGLVIGRIKGDECGVRNSLLTIFVTR